MKDIKQDDDLKNNWERSLEEGSLERVSEEVTHKLRLEGGERARHGAGKEPSRFPSSEFSHRPKSPLS